MGQNNEAEKAPTSLKKSRKRYESKRANSHTHAQKTELKTPTREPKKSVLESIES
ncbi:hypothetical protein KVD49_07245 [Helicobacter pylori]|nr:hypothetical protein KVD49_07245 [Helicobacter pylori]